MLPTLSPVLGSQMITSSLAGAIICGHRALPRAASSRRALALLLLTTLNEDKRAYRRYCCFVDGITVLTLFNDHYTTRGWPWTEEITEVDFQGVGGGSNFFFVGVFSQNSENYGVYVEGSVLSFNGACRSTLFPRGTDEAYSAPQPGGAR